MKESKYKILISAHEFSPYLGSECKHAWNVLKELSFKHQLTIVYSEYNQLKTNNYKEAVEKEKKQFCNETSFLAVSNPRASQIISYINKKLFGRTSNIGNPYLYFLAVQGWEKEVFRIVKKKKLDINTDVIHHFNHISFREPGYLWKLNKPFIWGPVSGTINVPTSFIKSMSFKEKIKNHLRNTFNFLTKKFSGRVYSASMTSKKILCVSNEDFEFFFKLNQSVEIMPDVGLSHYLLEDKNQAKSRKLKAALIGRIDSLKSIDIVIEAAYQSKKIQDNLDIVIIGEGPLLCKCKKIVENLGLESSFRFLGKIMHEEVQSQIRKVDFIIHPSIKEGTPTVLLEGLQCSKPFIAHNAFGISALINKNLGFGVDYINKNASISGFKDAIESILDNRNLLAEKKKSIESSLNELTYKKIAQDISDAYINIKK